VSDRTPDAGGPVVLLIVGIVLLGCALVVWREARDFDA
jgi:hypothetical protein